MFGGIGPTVPPMTPRSCVAARPNPGQARISPLNSSNRFISFFKPIRRSVLAPKSETTKSRVNAYRISTIHITRP